MGVRAVIGLQWGDEGKGKIVDALCCEADLAVRCQGGANAGHTVIAEGKKFILHLVPSGILREGVRCLIGNGVVLDLEVLEREISELSEGGIDTSGRITVSRRAHVVLPIQKRIEAIRETMRGRRKLDTTKRGIGPTYSDKYARIGIRVGDILNPATLPAKVQTLRRVHDPARFDEPFPDVEELLSFCDRYRPMLEEVSGDTLAALTEGLSNGKRILLEGAQGFLLDIDHGTYPFVTSCNTGVHGLACGAGLAPSAIDEVVGVVKAYMTRVGEGILPTQMEEPTQTRVREKGQEYGATTGRPRRCGWLDLNALRYACSVNGVTSLAITKLDILSELEPVRVCTAYDHSGSAVQTFPADVEFLEECVPVYVESPPWSDLGDINSFDDLPAGAAQYVKRILDTTGCKPELVSIGPERTQLVRVER